MNDALFKCEMCKDVLPTADAICTSCDKELTNSAQIFEQSKFFLPLHSNGGLCPICNHTSPRFEQVLYPENAPWYKFQETLMCCPVCKTRLRKKYETKKYQRFYVVVWAFWMLLQFTPTNQWTLWLRFIYLVSAISYLAIYSYRSFRDPVKYVPNEQPY